MKESEMFYANKILEKNKKKYERGEKLKEEKLKQIRRIFKTMLHKLIKKVNEKHGYEDEKLDEILANEYTNKMLYEVKIRANNK